ncbi:MAG: GrpB family protein [Phycisphaerales bacterium]
MLHSSPLPPRVVVTDYDPRWPTVFADLRARVAPPLAPITTRIEHVGSTSVPGLAAKPVIDLDIVVRDLIEAERAATVLEALGYTRLGDLGVPDRYAFRATPDLPRHNLYVVIDGSLALRNHLALRDTLRAHPIDAAAYGELKKRLASQHPEDVDAYCTAKTEFLLGVLRKAGIPPEYLREIAIANRVDPRTLGLA